MDTLLKAPIKNSPVNFEEATVKMTAYFSLETVETRRKWNVLKQLIQNDVLSINR